MFNLYRIKKKPIHNYFFNKRNYLPKNILSKLKYISLYKKIIYPSTIDQKENMNNYLIKKEKPEMIVLFYMILGIAFGSFIYYIKL